MFPHSKFQIQNSKFRAAFTLIEFALYIAVAVGLVTAAGAIGLNALFAKTKLAAVEEVAHNARFGIAIMTDRIERASAITSPGPGLGASVLILQMSQAAENPTEFNLSGGRLRMREGTNPFVDLTSDEVVITNLSFTNLSHFLTPGSARMAITIESANPSGRQEYEFQETFFTSASVRRN